MISIVFFSWFKQLWLKAESRLDRICHAEYDVKIRAFDGNAMMCTLF